MSGPGGLKLDLGNLNSNDPEEIKRMIMEQLKEQGMDTSSMKIQTIEKSDK